MKRILSIVAISWMGIAIWAQTWTTGTGSLYSNPISTKVGIGIATPDARLHIDNGALKIGEGTSATARSTNVLYFGDEDYVKIGEWESDDMLSFWANQFNFNNGYVGIGVPDPQYKLDVNGKVFLRTYDWHNATAYSYLHWASHNLVMGVPAGNYAVTRLDLRSGGSTQGKLFSEFTMYTANGVDNHEAKIKFNTEYDCWINTSGFIGIGTESPQNKLDVRGAIRADEIYVNQVSGADYVFDESYKLRPLSEVKEYVQKNQHLPEIPSADEMQRNGVNMNELQIQLLQKVEELTLYIIQQEQRIQELESQLSK